MNRVPEPVAADEPLAADEMARLLAANERYTSAGRPMEAGTEPTRRLAVVTCMDARIDPLAILGLRVGEAHVIRNAGGRLTDDVRRSLALSTHVLGVRTVVFMQHTKCGLTNVSNAELQRRTGADLDFRVIDDHAATLGQDIESAAATAFLQPVAVLLGLLYDVDTGEAREVVRWQRST